MRRFWRLHTPKRRGMADGFEEVDETVAFMKSLFFWNRSGKQKWQEHKHTQCKGLHGRKPTKKNSRKKAKGMSGHRGRKRSPFLP